MRAEGYLEDSVAPSGERKTTLLMLSHKGEVLDFPGGVYLPKNLTPEQLFKLLPESDDVEPAYTFPALDRWLTRLLKNFKLQEDKNHPFHAHPYKLRDLEIEAVNWWKVGGEDKLGFMKIQATIATDSYMHQDDQKKKADWTPGAVFLRGGSVAMLVCVMKFSDDIW
jgi:ADP-sugar diphosphatase